MDLCDEWAPAPLLDNLDLTLHFSRPVVPKILIPQIFPSQSGVKQESFKNSYNKQKKVKGGKN